MLRHVPKHMPKWDVIIAGGGIVGLATAYTLLQHDPGRRVLVLEKEPQVALHQTGRNSGVLHSGIYYKPGSIKAQTCQAGRRMMLAFCEENGIPVSLCGKVIVAVSDEDAARLDALHERGLANGIACELIGSERLAEIEPHAKGRRALHLPNAGVVDFRQVSRRLAESIEGQGGWVQTNAEVTAIREGERSVLVKTGAGDFEGRALINCAGLHSDRLVRMSGMRPPARIIPFRGEYYTLRPEAQHLCRALIYPVPDPRFPFLGVHLTRTAWGVVECGPNAVLALAREGYRKRDVSARDLAEILSYGGFVRLARQHWRMGAGEVVRSFSKRAFTAALQRMAPALQAEHLEPAPAGIRAQAVAPDGKMLDDFAFAESRRTVHVINAPSPAATASLSIAASIVERLAARL